MCFWSQFLSRQKDIYHVLNMLVGKCNPAASPAVSFWRNGVQKEYEKEEKEELWDSWERKEVRIKKASCFLSAESALTRNAQQLQN